MNAAACFALYTLRRLNVMKFLDKNRPMHAIDIDFSFPFLVVFRDLDLSFLAEKRNRRREFESLQENEYVSGTPYR